MVMGIIIRYISINITQTCILDISEFVSEYAGKDFHVTHIKSDLQDASSISQNMFDYQSTVYDVFVSLPFCYGRNKNSSDLFPKSSIFANAVIHPRTYEVTLIFSLESHVDLQISNLHEDTSFTQFDESNELIVQGSGRLELLWLGSEDRSSLRFLIIIIIEF